MKDFDITTPQELLDYMNENIRYGWLDNDDNEHVETLENFRPLYRTLTIEETLKHGLGTCIEQTNLEMAVMEKMGIEYKTYCLRSYKDDLNIENPRMHCFLIFYLNGNYYHFEHSNPDKRGIHEYASLEKAMTEILAYFQKKDEGKTRQLIEFNEVPAGLSWHEWNEYLNDLARQEKVEFSKI